MECVFCGLIADGSARWVTRSLVTCAFAPLRPLAPGHTLVVPTSHFESLYDAPPEVVAATMALAQTVAHAMRRVLGAGGVNVLKAPSHLPAARRET
ncbi:HIT domain-containing protein [Actinopolymorpha alba]|uniref:HIT domain-containing protein n=1 Tax=Actinopolymorpha alba TaxID=533267 RepID=UPI000A009307|nr:HIT domain-containing protein [Actinopolymorpha alba]